MQRFVPIRHYRVCWWRTIMRLRSTLVHVDAATDEFGEEANYWTPLLQIEGMEQGITSLTSARHRINPGKSFAVCIYPVNIDRRIIVCDLLHDRVSTVIRQRTTKYTRMVKLSSGATSSSLINKSGAKETFINHLESSFFDADIKRRHKWPTSSWLAILWSPWQIW